MRSLLSLFPDESPSHGTAVLSAAESNKEANALGKRGLTTFSDALLECLKSGRIELGERVSLNSLHAMILEYLTENYADTDRFVRPKVESPEASEGDVALFPVFPNPVFGQSENLGLSGEREEEERLKAEAAQRRKDERLKAEAAQREQDERLKAEATQREEEERLKAEAAQREQDERLKAEAAQRDKEQRRNQAALDRQLAEQLYQKLVRELSNGKIKTMVPGLRNIIKLNPEHARAHRDMASQLQLVGQWDEALAEARLAMRLGPTDESALRLHGEIVAAIAKRNAVKEAPVSGKDASKETSSRKREIVTKETELKEKAEAEQRYQVEATYLEGKACLDKHEWLKARRLLNKVSLMKPGHKDVEKLIASVEYRVILMLLGILGGIGAFSLIIYWFTYR